MADRSGSVVPPQEAFEELARLTLADQSMESVMDMVAQLTRRTVPGADEVSVTLVEPSRARTVACTGPLALRLDERQYERGHGPCLDCIEGAETVRIDSTSTEQRWPGYAAEAREHGVGSVLSLPVPLQREVAAGLNVYAAREHAFDDAAVGLGTVFAGYAAVALANMQVLEAQSRVVEQLGSAMQSRAGIEQAKGILMGQRRCSAEEAFAILVTLSQTSNRKLRDVAQAVVDQTVR